MKRKRVPKHVWARTLRVRNGIPQRKKELPRREQKVEIIDPDEITYQYLDKEVMKKLDLKR